MGLWSRLRNTWRGTRHAAEIRAELDFHREMLAAAGDDPRRSRLRLGNLAQVEEATRAVSVVEWLDSALRDARYGLRQLRRTPVLTGAVLLSLTIGIGANTAMFSLVDAALLKPLPVADPGRLRIVEWTSADFPARASNHNGEFRPIAGGLRQGSSVPAHVYRRLAREQTAFDVLIGMAAYPDAVSVAIGAAPSEQVSVQYVSANYFQGLGSRPFSAAPSAMRKTRSAPSRSSPSAIASGSGTCRPAAIRSAPSSASTPYPPASSASCRTGSSASAPGSGRMSTRR